ncbi:MAG: extracellular solute-binding protein [Chloroflexota bacterium]
MTTPDRRAFLRVGSLAGAAALAAACAPTTTTPPSPPAGGAPAPGAPAPAAPSWQKEWDDTVTAAKKEGKLVVVTSVGASYREAVGEFQKAYPDIQVEHTSLNASAFAPKVVTEQKGGVFNYDVATSTYGSLPTALLPVDGLAPIKPLFLRGDVLDNAVWSDGFEGGWKDTAKQYGYAPFVTRSRHFWVNTDLVKDGDIKNIDDIINPRWRGKVLALDPRSTGGYQPALNMRLSYGDEIIKKLWKDQEAVLIRDLRQVTEMMIRGSYALGISAPIEFVFSEFQAQGVGKNLKHLEIDGVENISGGSEVLFYFPKAPHPNASKVFVNWIMTKEGSDAWSKQVQSNSRRKDVPVHAAENVPTPGKKYPVIDRQEMEPERAKTMDMAKQVLGV